MDVIEEADNVLSRKATFLIGEVLALANKLLPGSTAADAQALPRLFTKAASLDAPLQKNQAITALSSIHRLNRTRLKNRPTVLATSRTDNRARSSSVTDPSTKGQRQVENVRIRLGWQVDDRHYQLMLNETGVSPFSDFPLARSLLSRLTNFSHGTLLRAGSHESRPHQVELRRHPRGSPRSSAEPSQARRSTQGFQIRTAVARLLSTSQPAVLSRQEDQSP